MHLHVENILRDPGDDSLDQYEAAGIELNDRREVEYQAPLDNNGRRRGRPDPRGLRRTGGPTSRAATPGMTSYAAALTAAITDRV